MFLIYIFATNQILSFLNLPDLLVSQLSSEDSDLESLFCVTEYFTFSSVLLMFSRCLSRWLFVEALQ